MDRIEYARWLYPPSAFDLWDKHARRDSRDQFCDDELLLIL